MIEIMLGCIAVYVRTDYLQQARRRNRREEEQSSEEDGCCLSSGISSWYRPRTRATAAKNAKIAVGKSPSEMMGFLMVEAFHEMDTDFLEKFVRH